VEATSLDKSLIIAKLSDLPCLLAYCDKSSCLSHTTNNEFIEVGFYLPVISVLLNDPTTESAPDVRRRIYSALAFILQHHSGKEDLELVINLLFSGLADPDRSVKISAGYVPFRWFLMHPETPPSSRALAGLVRFYALDNKIGLGRAESIFTKLYQFFEQSMNPIRETLLITVGSMAK